MPEQGSRISQQDAGILPQKYQDLHKSPEVGLVVDDAEKRGEKVPNNPKETVSRYLGSLFERHGLLGGDDHRRDRQISRHVIKPDEIPEGYFENQRKIAREQGHGDVEITPEARRQLTETVITDQRKSLENWVDYVNHPDANYPAWFRYYTIRSVLTLGPYDKEKNRFSKRSSGTTAPYVDLNREALAYVYDKLNQTAEGKPIEEIGDEKLAPLLKSKNFGKLYAHAIETVTPASKEQRQQVAGEWVKYDQGSEAKQLSDSLEGHGTGWCTAGESTAQMQLQGGDFHVYYSYDQDGKPTVPRVAVRMENGQVAELRGINDQQNLEPEMAETADGKLAELPGGEAFKKKAADMKRLTEIEKKHNDGRELNSEELKFFYEIDGKIEGFGYQRDPRIDELREQRNSEEDMPIVLNCETEQIATSSDQINETTKAYVGKLEPGIFDKLKEVEHIYTSFPEGKIRRDSVDIGGKTVGELEQELEANGVNISQYAKDMLHSQDFVTAKDKERIDLVRLKVGDLGLAGYPTTDQIYGQVKDLGLDLCPPEVGPQYRLAYKNQPMYEWLNIGMKQITDSGGGPSVFRLARYDDGAWLDNQWTRPDRDWNPGGGFVFRLSK